MSIRFTSTQTFATHQGSPLTLMEAAKWSDYARAHGVVNDVPPELEDNVTRAAELLKQIYIALGCTAEITSFFRCVTLNSAVGGKVKPPSAHMDGRAVDSVPQGVDIHEAFEKLKGLADQLEFDQLIIEHDRAGNTWLHSSVAKQDAKPRKQALVLEKQPVPDRHVQG